jgi:hypothetical protein
MIAMTTNANFWAAIAIIIVGLIAMAVDVVRWLAACERARWLRVMIDEVDTTGMSEISITLIDPREPPGPLMHADMAGLDAHR